MPKADVQTVDQTLAERRKTHGPFATHAAIACGLKNAMRESPNWNSLPSDAVEALDMIQHKVARILNGGNECADSWHDIAGYATLVERRINETNS